MLEKTLDSITKNSFLVEVFGLGYVGFPLAVRLASGGINVNGIDINQKRIDRLKNAELMDSEVYLKNEFVHCRDNDHLNLSSESEITDIPKIGIICV